VTVSGKIAAVLSAAPLDVVIEHLDVPAFDLIVATNILPYFDDVELMLAMSNVNRMLVPGGVFLHNEPRAALGAITDALGLPYEQSRRVVIAAARGTVTNGAKQPASLVDSVWLHRKVK
jgi:SAM-dependent methyltransferase